MQLARFRPPEHYGCTLSDGDGYADKQGTVRRRLLKTSPAWSDLAKVNSSEKLYVVKSRRADRSEFVYVGRTYSPMRVRMYRGLNARKYRYQWRGLARVDLYVCPLLGLGEKDGEAIEAELVYLVRHHERKWPTHQNEIHFRHELGVARPELRQLARDLYSDLRKK
jgi:hypothetical protein